MLHLIWKGWGFLVIVIAGGIALATQMTVAFTFHDPGFYNHHIWPKAFSIAVSAVGVYFTGRYFNSQPGRLFIDKATGEEFVWRRTHSLFFIPMEYWGFILAIGGVVSLIIK